MYYFIVLTNPDKEFAQVDELQKHISSKFEQSMIIAEMGDNGTNPHINCVVKIGTKRIDNIRRGILTTYYGPKLSDFEKIPGFDKYGAVGKHIKDYQQLKNVSVYLTKESNPPYLYDNGMDIDKLKEGMLAYSAHKKLHEDSCSLSRTAEQLLSEMIYLYQQECMEDNLNCYVIDYKPPIPQKHDFVRMLKLLAAKKYNLTPLTSKLKIYYVEFMTRLSNFDLLESMVDRIDEEINRPRN